MAYTLRLPDALDAAARSKADYLGISLNALLCVALDAYLRAPSPPNGGGANLEQAKSNEPVGAAVKLTRSQKQALYEEKKRLFAPTTSKKR